MSVYLLVNKDTGLAENAIEWDGETNYDPGAQFDLVAVSGDAGCPWSGWTRNNDGELEAPPAPVTIRYAVVKKLGGLVVDFRTLDESEPAALDEPASFEYQLVACPDESVETGATYDSEADTFS